MTTLNNMLGQSVGTLSGFLDDVETVLVVPGTNVGGQVRVTFTSAEVGNGNENDGNMLANQDGGLAVRLQSEDGRDGLVGDVARAGDEGVRFVSLAPNLRFDVRDLVSGVGRGNGFNVVQLGTMGADRINVGAETEAYYINAGMGDDMLTGGMGNDFLVGGAGADTLNGAAGNDSFIGGGGTDVVTGGTGDDTLIYTVATDGEDRINLGQGNDTMNVAGVAGTQVRLTFTSTEVGNSTPLDRGTLANQNGGIAVRLQGEDAMGELTGGTARVDDEGIRFVGTTPGVTFDVRDLVSGVGRGDAFGIVQLGTSMGDIYNYGPQGRAVYANGGMGNDTMTGGTGNDFLVGGAGEDVLNGGMGNDSFIGGGGLDVITGNEGDDTLIYTVATDGADRVNLGTGNDAVNVAGVAGTQVRLTFTSSEVGNGSALDSGMLANQNGGIAVRMQGEDAMGNLTGTAARIDDEGIRFVSTTEGVTFDVRDLVSGVGRGDGFEIVQLGTAGIDGIDLQDETRSVYVNGGMGNDTINGGVADDFLVGGAGNDLLNARLGDDSMIGGGGADTFFFGARSGDDQILDFVSGTDRIDLSALDMMMSDVSVTMMDGNTVISGDSNGNGDVDFTITLVNTTTFAESDFIF